MRPAIIVPMGSGSILGRIAKYGVSPVRDAREDRLTEIWAAIFDSAHCEGFARHVVLGWLRAAARVAAPREGDRFELLADVLTADGDWLCRVETQVPTTLQEERRRPDLELAFTGPASVSVWVEVKNETAPHDGQLSAYGRIQEARGLANAVVLLVAPRKDYVWFPEDELPPDVPQLSWEETGESIRSFAPESDPVQRFLLGELWSYTCDEELTDPQRLTPDHVAALENYPDARRALERLCDMTVARLRETWGGADERGTYPRRGEPRQYWWTHQPDDASRLLGADWWWDWKLLMDSTDILMDSTDILKEGARRPTVFVGVTGNPGAIARLGEGLRQSLADAGFDLLGPGATNGSSDFVGRHAYLGSDLVGHGDLPAQATTLAKWLHGAFGELRNVMSSASERACDA